METKAKGGTKGLKRVSTNQIRNKRLFADHLTIHWRFHNAILDKQFLIRLAC